MSDRKAVIKNADMGEDMQQDAVDCATQAIEKYNIEKVWFLITWCNLDCAYYPLCDRLVTNYWLFCA